MKHLYRILWLLVALGLKALDVSAQDSYDKLMRWAGNVHQFNAIFPQEKVWLEFDNTAYFQGETIWFKVYAVAATRMNPAPSKVVYVDFLSSNGVLLQRKKLKLVNGQADGCIPLYEELTEQAAQIAGSVQYPSGYYEVRAYTRNMLNFHDDLYFSRVFPVYRGKMEADAADPPVIDDTRTKIGNFRPKDYDSRSINVSFYPEGGSLIIGNRCRMAFRAVDGKGNYLDGKLVIKESEIQGNEPVTGKVEHDGMGSVVFTPYKKNMKATFVTADGSKINVTLPDALSSGYSLILKSQIPENMLFGIYRTADCHQDTIGLAVSCRGELIAFDKIPMNSLKRDYLLDNSGWPVGVCQLCLFSKSGQVLAYRSIFHQNTNFRPPEISVYNNKTSYSPMDSIRLKFQVLYRDKPLHDRFCISVRNDDDLGTVYSDNILTGLLLSSDLRGFVHKPDYYFESADSTHQRAADLLMMVQGWRRYEWNFSSTDNLFVEKYRTEDSLSVNGWILKSGRTPMKDIEVRIAIHPEASTIVELGNYVTGENGYWGFDTKDYWGNADLTMNLRSISGRKAGKAKMILERAMLPGNRYIPAIEKRVAGSGHKLSGISLIGPETDSVEGRISSFELPEVEIREKMRYVDYFTFRAYNVENDVETTLDLGENTTDILGYLLEKGHTMWIDARTMKNADTDDSSVNVKASDNESLVWSDGSFIDGTPVFWYLHDSHRCRYEGVFTPWSIDTKSIKSMMVYDDPATIVSFENEIPLFKDYVNGQGLSLSSFVIRKGIETDRYILIDVLVKDDWNYQTAFERLNTGTRITTLKGFTAPIQFYSPQYPDGPVDGLYDYRRTLYWNPNVVTDENGHAEVEFYNNSYSTHFRVTGAGITASGTPYVLDSAF